jgi:hypothetical protein
VKLPLETQLKLSPVRRERKSEGLRSKDIEVIKRRHDFLVERIKPGVRQDHMTRLHHDEAECAALRRVLEIIESDRETFLAVELALRADAERLRNERDWWSDRADALEAELEELREKLRAKEKV